MSSKQAKESSLILAIAINSMFLTCYAEASTGYVISADTSLNHTDNVYRVVDSLAQSDTYIMVGPEFNLDGQYSKAALSVNYSGEYAKFTSVDEANYTDHAITLGLELDHTLRFNTNFEAGYQREHEEPGEINRIQLLITEYNQYELKFAEAGFALGRNDSIGQLAINFRTTDREYLNNGLEFLNSINNRISATFSYKIAPKTRLYLDAASNSLNYDPPEGSTRLDNEYEIYSVGVVWNLSNKVRGDVRVGYQSRDYVQEGLQDITGLSYRGKVDWFINSYTTVVVNATRESNDSSIEEVGGFLRTLYGLSVTHQFTEAFGLDAACGYVEDELVYASERVDKRYMYSLGMDYKMNRRMEVWLNFEHNERDSTDSIANFDTNLVSLNLNVTLGD